MSEEEEEEDESSVSSEDGFDDEDDEDDDDEAVELHGSTPRRDRRRLDRCARVLGRGLVDGSSLNRSVPRRSLKPGAREARRSVRLLAKELSNAGSDDEVMATPRGATKRRARDEVELELGTDGKARRPR
jgi:hypothetical protein